ncbi:hypothetical protein [Paenibacillus puerhi]|uniref:hypothetical protein n=1 Tax=Paenibacillus puerhi TaxID=2692622 RepID=UPI0013580E96|nr:hypothetical protein [Paenibacillus puerhi]
MEEKLHPELKEMFSFVPETIYTEENIGAARNEMNEIYAGMAASLPVNDSVVAGYRTALKRAMHK